MAFTEDLSVFFNSDEFGTLARVDGKSVIGFFSNSIVLVNEVETRKPIFTCPEQIIAGIKHGSLLSVHEHLYQVVGFLPGSPGITTLILERAE